MADSVVLTFGRENPVQGDTVKRGEGVAIVLTDWAIDAWKAAGRQWKAWSPRAVSMSTVGGRSRDKLHIVSCYAPTRAAGRQEKNTFFDELNSILSSVLAGEKYRVLGDFNAHVGSRKVVGDQWSKVRGPHGCVVTNDAVKELLGFLSTQQATVCNKWFRKKEIHRVTWQHLKSMQWSCIDYVIMRECDRRMYSDITVRRGAKCNTDHEFLCASVKMAWRGLKKRAGINEGKRYDVSGLVSCKGSGHMTLADHCSNNTLRKCWREPHLHGQRKGQWKRDGK